MSARTILDPAIHLPEHCPACYAPILKWEAASTKDKPRGPIRPEIAEYDCGLELAYQGSVKDPAETAHCVNAFHIAVKLRREAS